ncbi:hypothetical protein [Actinoplanes sandaracinus]|uniref:hypothetical protein n=1 Tax=Actinoplanes sandaracinus TaxID=3045177 RepID=UPI002E234623
MDPNEAFAELGRIRLADVDINSLMDKIAQLAKRAIPGAGAHSSLPIGLPVHEKVAGALSVYATETHAFDDDAITLAQTCAGFAAVAPANAHLYETQATLAAHMR